MAQQDYSALRLTAEVLGGTLAVFAALVAFMVIWSGLCALAQTATGYGFLGSIPAAMILIGSIAAASHVADSH